MSVPPPIFMGDMDQFRRDQERYRVDQERFKNQPPLDLLGSFPRTDQRYDPGREYQTVIDPQPLDMGGIGMLQQGRMGPLSGLGQYISQELEQQNQGEVDEFIGEVGDMANQRFGVDLGSVGQRPMFRAEGGPVGMEMGGAAFPDLSGDGKITQKDILMGRGVIPKQHGGPIGMENGGPTTPAQEQFSEIFRKFGLTREEFESLPVETQLKLLGATALTQNNRMSVAEMDRMRGLLPEQTNRLEGLMQDQSDKFRKFGMDALSFKQLPAEELDRLRGLMPEAPRGPTTAPMPTAPQGPRTAPMPSIDEETMQQLLRQQSLPQSLAEGGMAMPMPPQPAPPMPMEAAAPQEQLDPNVVQQALSQAAGGIASLDEAQNYEDVMNSMRGDQASVEQRRQELAGVVGPGDASQTPESVLTLVQPVMMLANVDQGIGGLAQEEMTQPMEGPMAQGIMSTVPEPPMEAGGTAPVNFNKGGEVRPVEYFDPQNSNRVVGGGNQFTFNPAFPYIPTGTSPISNLRVAKLYGGPDFGSSGDPDIDNKVNESLNQEANKPGTGKNRLQQLFESQLELYRKVGLGDAAERQAMAEQQKRMTKAQMLFDIASTALAFAAPMEGERPGLSPAERLAMAARSTQLPEKIGARAQAQLQLEKEAAKEERAIELAALQSAETKLAAEKAAADAIALANAKAKVASGDLMVAEIPGGQNIYFYETGADAKAVKQKVNEAGGAIYKVSSKPAGSTKAFNVQFKDKETGNLSPIFDKNDSNFKINFNKWLENNPGDWVEGKPITLKEEEAVTDKDYFDKFGMNKETFFALPKETQDVLRGIPTYGEAYYRKEFKMSKAEFDALTAAEKKILVGLPAITDKDYFLRFGFKKKELEALSPENQAFVRGLPVVTEKDFFSKYGMKREAFEALPLETRQYLQGLPVVTGKDYFQKFGMDQETFNNLSGEFKNKLLGLAPERDIKVIDGEIYEVVEGQAPKIIGGEKLGKPANIRRFTINGVEQVIDINDPNFDAFLERYNKALADPNQTATVTTVTGEATPKAYYQDNNLYISYDNGKTYTNEEGKSTPMPTGAVPLSDTTTFDVIKSTKVRKKAAAELAQLDGLVLNSITNSGVSGDWSSTNNNINTGGEGQTRQDIVAVRDALEMARKGTGFYSAITALLDNASSVVPGFLKPEFVQEFGRDTQRAKQYLRAIRVLGRSALVVNNRFPVAEMATVGVLFPDPDRFFRDPTSEADKFIALKQQALEVYRINLRELETGLPKDLERAVQANNLEIKRLLSLLQGVNTGSTGGVSQSTIENINRLEKIAEEAAGF